MPPRTRNMSSRIGANISWSCFRSLFPFPAENVQAGADTLKMIPRSCNWDADCQNVFKWSYCTALCNQKAAAQNGNKPFFIIYFNDKLPLCLQSWATKGKVAIERTSNSRESGTDCLFDTAGNNEQAVKGLVEKMATRGTRHLFVVDRICSLYH